MKGNQMKLLILCFIAVMMVLPLMANEFDADSIFIVPKVANGSLTMDGVADEPAWGVIMTSEISDESTADDYYVLFGVLHDDDRIYFYFQVSDDELHYAETATWDTDAIEVYIDGDDSKEGTWDGVNDYQVTTPLMAESIDDWQGTNPWLRDNVEFAINETALGWDLEYSVPMEDWDIGSVFGFDVAHNDADETGARETQTWFAGGEGASWSIPSDWNYAALGDMLELSGVEDELGSGMMPAQFSLEQNYPNPFNPSTTIPFSIDKRSTVQLTVYNVLGEKIATLVDGIKEAGSYQVPFNASHLNSGVYYYQLKKGAQVFVNKMLYIK